jgi:hypothetical protein
MPTLVLKQTLQSPHTTTQDLWSHRAPAGTGPLNRPLPYRAFELKEVIEYNKAILVNYREKQLEGPHAFPKWDKAKQLMRTHAIEAWEKKVKDMAIRKEAIEAKWIQTSGKPNKEFLAKPRAARKRIGNMTIDNIKDQPHLPRTDDINIILHNFVEYYSKLYEHKRICPVALNRLIKNLTLN